MHINDLSAWCNIDFKGGSLCNPLYYAHNLYLNGELVTDLVIPSDVTEIKGCVFSGCESLESVTIGDSVTTIGYLAFSGCTGLESVTIGDNVTSIGEQAFSGIGYWKNQPDGLLYVDGWLLSRKGDKPLGDIVVADGTKGIADYILYGCNNLTSVVIPNSVTSIGEGAFAECADLTSVTIGNSVTEIRKRTFEGCTSLESLTIGNSVTTIVFGAFYCNNLTSIYLMGVYPPTVGAYNFTEYENAVLYVPKGTLATYRAANVWKNFKNIREFDTTDIEDIATDDSHNGRSNTYYNLRGQAVEQPARGIYIYNGKKVFIK